jgi:hypothetical protein
VTWLGRQTDLSFRLHGGLLGGRGVHYSSLIRAEKSEANWKMQRCGRTREAGGAGPEAVANRRLERRGMRG